MFRPILSTCLPLAVLLCAAALCLVPLEACNAQGEPPVAWEAGAAAATPLLSYRREADETANPLRSQAAQPAPPVAPPAAIPSPNPAPQYAAPSAHGAEAPRYDAQLLAAASEAIEPEPPAAAELTPAPAAPLDDYGAVPLDSAASVSRRLAPAGARAPHASNESATRKRSFLPASFSKLESLSSAGTGLAIVVGLFLVSMWLLRRSGPKPTGALPSEAFAVLGRAPLTAQSFAQLLRIGNKLVLVAVGADGAHPLAEVTDPAEVDRIAGLCVGGRPGGSSAEFQQVLAQLSREPARGFLGREGSSARRRA